jgi:hypothetical protein
MYVYIISLWGGGGCGRLVESGHLEAREGGGNVKL